MNIITKPNKLGGIEMTNSLEDVKINVKIKLSALWIAVMFLYVYADFKALLQPGLIELIIAGELLISIKITQEWKRQRV